MTAEAKVIERSIELWNAHDRASSTELVDGNAQIAAPGGMRVSGKRGWEQLYDTWTNAFPDNRIENALIFGGEGHAAQAARFIGTQTGTLQAPGGDIPATGRKVDIRYCVVYRLENGLVTSLDLYFDQMDLLNQLGLVPQTAGAAGGA
jgi:predicted ester cyclase